jgi:hypothetical protein
MINPPAREPQARPNILDLQVREFAQYLLGRKAARQEIKNIGHADTHPTDAGPSATLLRIDRDSLCQIRHSYSLLL